MHRSSISSHRPLAAALIAAFGLVPLAAQAATVTVNSNADPTSTGQCTLRSAIVTMNHGASPGGNEGSCRLTANTTQPFGTNDTIVFDKTAFPNGGTNTITLTNGSLSIATPNSNYAAADLTIDATANSNVTIDAGKLSGAMYDGAAAGISLTLEHLTLSNGSAYSGGGINIPDANLTLDHSTLSGNTATGYNGGGGGIKGGGSATLTITNSTLSGNSATGYYGGGGGIGGGATVTVTNSTLSGNTAYNSGGGINSTGTVVVTGSTLSGNSCLHFDGSGGGIASGATGGTVTVTNSTLSGNSVDGYGGGIVMLGGTLTVSNSTLSGNTAGSGGGIYASGGAFPKSTVSLIHATVSNNTAHANGGGIDGYGSGTAANSIIAGNTSKAGGGDVNLKGTGGLAATNSIESAINLNLGPLQNNGGPTQTMLPGAGSTAIDAVPAGSCSLATDQRGVPRPQGSLCDIGAVEVTQYALTVMVLGNGSVSASPTPQSGAITNCTASCTADFLGEGSGTPTTVTLNAVNNASGQPVTWGGACASAGIAASATVTMTQAQTCTAAMSLPVTLQSFYVN